jgi:hypothetical protein
MGARNEVFLLSGTAPSKEELVDAIPVMLCQWVWQHLTANEEPTFHIILPDEPVHRENNVGR